MDSEKQLHDEVGAALAIAWAQVKEREEVWIVVVYLLRLSLRTKSPVPETAVSNRLSFSMLGTARPCS